MNEIEDAINRAYRKRVRTLPEDSPDRRALTRCFVCWEPVPIDQLYFDTPPLHRPTCPNYP